MKRFLSFIFSLIIIQQSQAQWEPFVINQFSYYMQGQADGSKKVETFLMDKYGTYNGYYSYIFNGYGDMPDQCYTNLRKEYTSPYYINDDKIEYLPIVGNRFFYFNPGTINYIEFRPQAAIGASWTSNGLTFTCADKVLKNVLGIADSVKIFKCLTAPFDTIEIELSKSFGFTKFLPFKEFFDPNAQNGRSPYFELIGYKKGNIQVGYQQAKFSDYFLLNVGDELYWKFDRNKNNLATTEYYYDKVTKVTNTAASVYYEFDRTVVVDGVIKNNLQITKTYLKSFYDEMVDGKTSWYGSTNSGAPTSKPYWVWPRILKVNNEDTITYSNFLLDGRVIDPSNCSNFGWDEAYFTYYWSTDQGETFNRYETLGLSETTTLLGSKINGKTTGTLVVPSVPQTTQGWKLFNKDQKTMYLQRYNNSLKAESFLVDSTRSENGDEYSYFNSKSDQFGKCYPQFKSFIKHTMPSVLNESKIDSLVLSGDSVLFISDIQSKIDTFLFKPYSNVGESWETNDLTIKCIAKIPTNIFGFTDSLKAFQVMTAPYDTMVFVLSKSYGFLKFWPLNEFIKKSNDNPRMPYFELIGFNNGATAKGYQQPDFSDYFHLKVGDVLYWKDAYYPYALPDPTTIYYYIDTIQTVYISADSVHYDFKRTNIKDGKFTDILNTSIYYLRKKEGIIVEGPTSGYGLKSDQINNLAYYLDPLELIIENNDTVTIATLSNEGLSLKDDCSTYVIIDYDGVDKYSTKEGFIFHGSYSWGPHELNLIGSIINGKESGITNIETSVSKPIEEASAIYPNPVHDVLNLKLSKPGNSIEIYDMNNKLLFDGSYTEQIDVSSLNPGVYILRVNYSNVSKFVRIVKQ